MALAYRVPGVYFERRPRAAPPPVVRTDVVGFVGFEPRVRDGTTPSALIGATGHAFRVDVSGIQLVIHGVRARIPDTPDVVLSANPLSIPMAAGASRAYTIAVAEREGAFHLVVVTGAAAPTGSELAPSDASVQAQVDAALSAAVPPPKRHWVRLADVVFRRDAAALGVTVHPGLPITRCDDWNDYLLAFGTPRDDGTLLGAAVRAYFANGGSRCWIATVRRPRFDDAPELARVRQDFVGAAGASEEDATGLARLLLVEEVTACDVPDVHAWRMDRTVRRVPLPATEAEACFLPCDRVIPPGAVAETPVEGNAVPLFDSEPLYAGGAMSPLFATQRALLERCLQHRWRMLLLLSVPVVRDPTTGRHEPPAGADAQRWVSQFDRLPRLEGVTPEEMSCAALYWPWLLTQEFVGAPTRLVPPAAYAAAVLARRDLARGPGVAPANETLRQVVGLAAAVDDALHGALNAPEPGPSGVPAPSVNVVRPFAGYGLQLFGARTLSTERLLRFVSVRRTLTAIELNMRAALELVVFEPNVPALWMQVATIAFGILMPLFDAGVLRGERPEEAFFVRCDESVNPPASVAAGRFVVQVGVAIAAPAEFIVFRVGRMEGVVEVLE